MIDKPSHAQRIEFLIEELYTLEARERRRRKKKMPHQLDQLTGPKATFRQ